MKSDHLEHQYSQQLPVMKNLKDEALYILQNAVENANIKVHTLFGRVKEIKSFIKKVEQLEIENPFDDVKDLVGLRIVCLLRSDILRIGEIIRNEFAVLSEDNKIEGKDISSFGYQSLHFLVKIKPEYCGPRYDLIKSSVFEIQIRTIAMDAWAAVSHYLDYKSEHDVPSTLRKDFYALSGLFYVVDTHFEMFYQAGIKNREDTKGRIASEGSIQDEQLNIDTLRAYILRKIKDHEIPDFDADVDSYSGIIQELVSAGYNKISQIDSAIDRGWDAFLEYEKMHPPHSPKGKKFNAIGVIRGLMSIVDKNYYLHRLSKPSDEGIYSKFRYLVKT